MININDTFRSYVAKIKEIYDNWEKITAENTEMTLSPTRKGKMSLLPKGNTSQETTTGKNLVRCVKTSPETINGVTFTPVYENGMLKYINVNGTSSANTNFFVTTDAFVNNDTLSAGTYTLSDGVTGESGTTYFTYMDAQIGDAYNLSTVATSTVTMPQGTKIKVRIVIRSGVQLNNVKFYPMVRSASITDDTYEPYTNGASPNSEFPSIVGVVTGDNEIIVSNKNWFDDYFPSTDTKYGVTKTKTDRGIVVNGTYNNTYNLDLWLTESSNSSLSNNATLLKANTQYTVNLHVVSGIITSSSNLDVWISSRTKEGTNFNWNYQRMAYNSTKKEWQTTFTVGNDDIYVGGIRLPVPTSVNATFDNVLLTVQIEKGSNASEYVEHKEQVFPISLGDIKMRSVGDLDDYFYKENDTWYKYSEIKEVALNRNSYAGRGSLVQSGTYRYYVTTPNSYKEPSTGIARALWCNRGKAITRDNAYNLVGEGISYTNFDNQMQIVFNTTMTLNIEQFKDWLDNNETYIQYQLETPEITEITDETLIEQLNNIYENAKSYQDETNISQTNDNLPFIISASALKKGGN